MQPEGELVIQTIPMPAHTNANGDIFGGWLVSQMDLGGAVLAARLSKSRIATVAIDGMSFMQPVSVGDLVSVYAKTIRTGRTSVTLEVSAWVRRKRHSEINQVTHGLFTFVAIDDEGKSRVVDWKNT